MKRLIALFLAVSLCALFAVSCGGQTDTEPTYTTRPTDTTAPQVTTAREWAYEEIDLSGGQYKPTDFDPDASSVFGYRKGTYEYDYFQALCGISYYAMLVRHYLDYEGTDTQDGFVSAYLKTENVESFTAPYESILYHIYMLLSDREVDLIPVTLGIVVDYWLSTSYELSAEERMTVLALSFNGIDLKLTEYAEELLALPDKYPNYAGEFTLSEKAVEEAEALIEACKPVAEKRESLRESWRLYYREKEPTLTVKEEFVAEHNAVKITLSGNGRYYLHNLRGIYVENYQYEIFTGSTGQKIAQSLPMESPVVIYLPVSHYRGTVWDRELEVVKADENGRLFYETVKLTLDPADCYSGEPIEMSNPFLDAVFRKFFGGDYSERDLLAIQILTINYAITDTQTGLSREPSIYLGYYTEDDNDGSHLVYASYSYSEFFDEKSNGNIPAGLEEDLKHFHALTSIQVRQELKEGNKNNPYEFSEGFLESLMPYEMTEDTWSEQVHEQ